MSIGECVRMSLRNEVLRELAKAFAGCSSRSSMPEEELARSSVSTIASIVLLAVL